MENHRFLSDQHQSLGDGQPTPEKVGSASVTSTPTTTTTNNCLAMAVTTPCLNALSYWTHRLYRAIDCMSLVAASSTVLRFQVLTSVE